jgi:hypothetical protein
MDSFVDDEGNGAERLLLFDLLIAIAELTEFIMFLKVLPIELLELDVLALEDNETLSDSSFFFPSAEYEFCEFSFVGDNEVG